MIFVHLLKVMGDPVKMDKKDSIHYLLLNSYLKCNIKHFFPLYR